MSQRTSVNTRNINAYLGAIAAGLGYGAWALLANIEHGHRAAWLAGVGQGVYAFIFTLLLTQFSLKIYHLRGFAQAYVGSALLMLAVPLTLHQLLRTPDTWQAILPGLIIGNVYIWIVLKKAQREAKISHNS